MFIEEAIKDKVTYANLIEMLKPNCEIIINNSNGFIIYHSSPDMNVLVCDCKDGFEEKFLEEILKLKKPLLQILNNKLVEMVVKNKYQIEGDPSLQAVYRGERIDSSGLISLRKEDLEFVKNTYIDGTLKEYVQHIFDENYLCGYYENNELIGYVGKHSKNNIGLLYVKPEYRRNGYGSKILRMAFSKCEDFGNPYPYTHIYETNEPSLKLHKKIGCEFGKKTITWIRRTEK